MLHLVLGPLAKHDDGKPDYLGRLRESFRRGEPLIPELKPFVSSAPRERLSVTFTSELEMDDCAIIEKYHGLTQVEDQFREMKGTLDTRPVFVSTPEHIRAHLMVCFIALTMMRLIQRKTQKTIKPRDGNHWSYGIPGARLTKALNNWKVDELPGDYYRIQGMGNEDIRTILDAFNLDIKPKIYTKGEIRELKASVSAF